MISISIPATEATPAQLDRELEAQQVALARAQALGKSLERRAKRGEGVADCEYAEVQEATERATVVIDFIAGEFVRRGGWSRYFLVDGGHLHYDATWGRCSRTMTTQHYLIHQLSGLTADEAIEVAGERVCTTCFPQAPVAVQNRPSTLLTPSEREKAQAAAERAQKRAEKAEAAKAKGIVDPETGGELRINTPSYRELVKTERTAMNDLVTQLWNAKNYGDAEYYQPAVDKLVAALAHKHGCTVAEELEAAQVRLAAREKREAKLYG